METPVIRVLGARQNNLKNLDLEIPLYRLTVVTGVSGSGKSSLAFDTLYAEGQRRYVESFSAYARQFLERLDRPRMDRIEGIPPAIAIRQVNPIKTARSTVATLTELSEYIKLLFAKVSSLYCPRCGREVRKESAQEISRYFLQQAPGARAALVFPVRYGGSLPFSEIEAGLRRSGYYRLFHQGRAVDVSEPLLAELLPGEFQVIADRLVLQESQARRLVDSLEAAFRMGKGKLAVILHPGTPEEVWRRFSTEFHCPECDLSFREPAPNLFSFNTPLGACEACHGFGRTIGVDLDLVVPDPRLTIRQGAIKPWMTDAYYEAYRELLRFCKERGIPADEPFQNLQPEHRQLILEGCEEFYGVKGFFEWLETKTYKMHIRVLLSRYRSYDTCRECGGTRFRREVLQYRLGGRNIAEVYSLPIREAYRFFSELPLTPFSQEVGGPLLEEIRVRLQCLDEIGLGYLTLDRQSRTLSGGEVERAHLTTALSSSLVNTLYILDEPSVGLHPRDTQRLLAILREIRDRGNTVVVVEHDPEIILAADHLLDLGPLAGEQGGSKVYLGPPAGIARVAESVTGRALFRKGRNAEGTLRRTRPQTRTEWLAIRGATEHNLKNISLTIPLQRLVCITGVSGSGKTTLMREVLYRGLCKLLNKGGERPGRHESIEGYEKIEDVILVDPSPLGNTPRANAVTYVKAFDGIRSLFAETPAARLRGYTAGTFSFNSGGGRCEACQGEGFEKVEMQFLADVFVACPECGGARYRKEILEVTYQGKTIRDVLEMTVEEGRAFFEDAPPVRAPLEVLAGIGLGYLKLGQPLNTLSGGEAQRLKLSAHILRSRRGHTLLLFDEPTTGLHLYDIRFLLKTFEQLLQKGHSLVVVEHNLEIIRNADYVVDLGPEGGEAGGEVVAQGPLETLMQEERSRTGAALHRYLAARDGKAAPAVTPRRLRSGALGPGTPTGKAAPPPSAGALAAAECGKTTSGSASAGSLPASALSVGLPAAAAPRDGATAGAEPRALRFFEAGPDGERMLIQGAREHNLKGITLAIPRDQIVVVTGPSGSGKSTLAFDILFAEGQRRFLESLSAYARQYIQPMAKPDVDRIRGVPPTVAVEQRLSRGGRRSTVATLTEIYHYLRLLYAKIGTPYCTSCGAALSCQGPEGIYQDISRHFRGKQVLLLAAILHGKKGHHRELFQKLRKMGYSRVRLDGELLAIENIFAVDRYKEHDIDVVVAEVDLQRASGIYLREKLEEALRVGRGDVCVVPKGRGAQRYYSKRLFCTRCGIGFPEPDPRHFSFNSRFGACPRCEGMGAIAVGESDENRDGGGLTAEWETCPECAGSRLQQRALSVRIAGQNIAECTSLTPGELKRFLNRLPLGGKGREAQIAKPVLQELEERLELMSAIGLGYLGLDRSADTLSQGEARRVRIVAQLTAHMRGLCYILDEPTIGLHPRDTDRLLKTLWMLRDRGNSIVVVEHDEETIRKSDYVVDLGPGAGRDGGEVIFAGPVADLFGCQRSLTARFLALRRVLPPAGPQRPVDGLRRGCIRGARENNLKNLNIKIPLRRLTVVTGVSGSGKSTLVREVLYKGLRRQIHKARCRPGRHDRLSGWGEIRRVLEVDSSPIGKTARSVPATYVGIFEEVRKLFALVPEARARGYTASRFSFNLKQGQCARCEGRGRIRMEMSFLPDVFVLCDACNGTRYNDDTLAVTYRGQSVAEVLAMTVSDAREFFSDHPALRTSLTVLEDIGLGYLTLGQPSNTLSGGETQRLKLAEELCRGTSKETLYVLDEPTTGLHLSDIQRLMAVIRRLVDQGNTVIVIEHNLEVVARADYIVDLGPEGGSKGGEIVAAGSPADLILGSHPRSHTAAYLSRYFEGNGSGAGGADLAMGD